MAGELMLYKDASLKERLTSIDFGRPFVGTKNEIRGFLVNSNRDWPFRNIEFMSNDEEVRAFHPTDLGPGEIREVTIVWSPSAKRRTPLDVTPIFTGDLNIG